MRVIGAGFGRTGTTSLKAALGELGVGPSYTLGEVFAHPEHVARWEAARRGDEVGWEEFLAGYEVAVDWPACSFYAELMRAFPDAPVILTVRDKAAWYESTRSTIHRLRRLTTGPLPLRVAFALVGPFAPGPTGTVRLADRLVWEDTFHGRFEDGDYARGSSSATTRRSAAAYRRRGCWSSTCGRAGRRSVISSASRSLTDPSPTSTRPGR